MKKYLAMFAVLFTVILSSCSNDDIPVAQKTTFKINPNTVISNFQEFNAGDLTVISDRFHLRVRLLVYNEEGVLVTEDEQFFDDYSHLMTSTLDLSVGERYKAMAITDIVRKSDSFEYWELSGKENLSSLKIADTGYIGSQRNILGISNTEFIAGDQSQINIDVQPAGSLMIVYYEGIRSWSNISEYQLGINRSADYVTFNKDVTPEWNIQSSSSFDWRISNIKVADWDDQPKVQNIYDYVFTLPYGNTNMCFQAKKKSPEEWIYLTQYISLDLGLGSEYLVMCNIADQEISYEKLASGRSRAAEGDILSSALMSGEMNKASDTLSEIKKK